MSSTNVLLVLQLLTLIIPLDVYVIGDWLGSGIQWALFRFQETYAGASIIPFTSDLGYVVSGTITGKTALSMLVSGIGSCLLIAAFCLILFTWPAQADKKLKTAGILTIAGGILFAVSAVIQYGIFFSGPAGFVLPIGIPLILIIGWMVMSGYYRNLLPDCEIEVDAGDVSEETG